MLDDLPRIILVVFVILFLILIILIFILIRIFVFFLFEIIVLRISPPHHETEPIFLTPVMAHGASRFSKFPQWQKYNLLMGVGQWHNLSPVAASRSISPRLLDVIGEYAKLVIAPQGLKEFPPEKINLIETIRRLLDDSPTSVSRVFFFGLWAFEWSALFFYLNPFTRLLPSQRHRHYQRWNSFFGRHVVRLLNVFVFTAYYSHPDVARSVGFEDKTETGRKTPKSRVGILPVPQRSLEREVEVCVIGSGAGGAVVAKELSERGHEVLILEEGDYFSRDDFQTLSTLTRNRLIYRDGGLFATIGLPMVLLPTGCAVGGTTVINSGTCFRTPDSILKRWQEESGLESLTTESLSPLFDKIEKTLGVGPVPEGVLGANDRILMRGMEKMGFCSHPLLRNAPGCRGSGVCIFGCPTGAKQSMEASYLPKAFASGATLYPRCRVERLVTAADRVVRIEATFRESRLTVYPKKVIVSCGTLSTPLLLRRSGIGLRSGELGKNLSIHPTGKIVGLFDETVDGFKGVPQASYLPDDAGELMYESVFFPPWLLATSLHHSGEELYQLMRAYRNLAIFGFLVHDRSLGRVYEGKGGRPLVFYNLGKREMGLFRKGFSVLGRVFFAAGAKRIFPTLKTISRIDSVIELDRVVASQVKRSSLEAAAFHPLGTCRMGISPRNSVVDPELRVHELENLWVADGSIFPSSLGVNPQITIMAFATRCAETIHRER